MTPMAHSVSALAGYDFSERDRLLLDTNVWLFVHGPRKPVSDSRVEIYSHAFAGMLEAGCHIHTGILILSEFVNAYAKVRCNLAKVGNLKEFHASPAFKPAARDIAADAKRVLDHCEWIENEFAELNVGAIINAYEKGDSGFNDRLIVDLCRGFRRREDSDHYGE
uniref:PIN domain n=1 Tax=Candidatus Kentrum sp. SD TaxID=2126332 RepID=A0A450YFL4_9GAMM|nr:MAG: PIN domain [Candidatus Kentron sp. SD]VFK45982.1 MAG: PIN domain [Candidatus Kentron sp. SD]